MDSDDAKAAVVDLLLSCTAPPSPAGCAAEPPADQFASSLANVNQRLAQLRIAELPIDPHPDSDTRRIVEIVGQLLVEAESGTVSRTESEEYTTKVQNDYQMERRRNEELQEAVAAYKAEESRLLLSVDLIQKDANLERKKTGREVEELKIQVRVCSCVFGLQLPAFRQSPPHLFAPWGWPCPYPHRHPVTVAVSLALVFGIRPHRSDSPSSSPPKTRLAVASFDNSLRARVACRARALQPNSWPEPAGEAM
eukprot:SAG22_NODE_2735_length_2266_cov_1.352100_1_plen_252_part_00